MNTEIMKHDRNNLIDVNYHRCKEGLRVLEDIARFILKDDALFKQIKALKHRIQTPDFPALRKTTQDDLGGVAFKEGPSRPNLMALLKANAARVQESARMLEECHQRELFKTVRFQAYDLYLDLYKALSQYLHLDQLKAPYLRCDPAQHALDELAKQCTQTNASMCLLQVKQCSPREAYDLASQFRGQLPDICLILDAHPDIAKLCANGVHLDHDGAPISALRQLFDESFVIGQTCENRAAAEAAYRAGASFVSLGDADEIDLPIPICNPVSP